MNPALALMLAMPCLLMTLCIGCGRVLHARSGGDDVWCLPRPSSLR